MRRGCVRRMITKPVICYLQESDRRLLRQNMLARDELAGLMPRGETMIWNDFHTEKHNLVGTAEDKLPVLFQSNSKLSLEPAEPRM